VVVFGASNFPLAFSTLGGDSISALAAQCPVIYKTHPAHPKTTQLCDNAVQKAIKEYNLPGGVFQITSPDFPGLELVKHPLIEAVGFTGSFKIGSLIHNTATTRPKPIPAYCEMSSVNPIFIFPDALKTKFAEISQGLSGSVTLGAGQFCTNPGLVFLIGNQTETQQFINHFVNTVSQVLDAPLLTTSIMNSYRTGVKELSSAPGIKKAHYKPTTQPESLASPAVFTLSLHDFLKNPSRFQEELFGPSTILVQCPKLENTLSLPDLLEGQLTATFHGTPNDAQLDLTKELIDKVTERVGRVVWGGFPTGVEVNTSIQHGGPWPASSDSRTTSVGTRAILRWVRPVAFQSFPPELLPPILTDKKN
jgi:NADP-dependent aldehyde dehydrogenase